MKIPEKPADEKKRLSVLNELNIVHTPAEERFDRITRLAKMIFKVPIALVSLVDEDTQWFKSSQGLAASETPREVSFCGHAILANKTFIVPDALQNPDFADNPLVVNDPHVRFYAGEPISVDSQNLGTLCLIDHEPRDFSDIDADTLKSLARMIENELKLTLYTQPQKEMLSNIGDIERKSLIDPLTGCWNKKGFDLLIKKELDKARKEKIAVSLMLIEVNNNVRDIDLLEHDLNNIVKEAAQRIRSCIRLTDIIGRHETNQFIIYLSNCSITQCRSMIQDVLRSFSIWRYEANKGLVSISVKIGYTCNQDTNVWSSSSMLETTESALKEVKEKGNGFNERFKKP